MHPLTKQNPQLDHLLNAYFSEDKCKLHLDTEVKCDLHHCAVGLVEYVSIIFLIELKKTTI